MSNFSLISLQKAIYEALMGDSAMMALITGVYDHTPQNSEFPYVTFGDALSRDWSNAANLGMEQSLTLYVWSREGGRKEAISIMERIYSLLHQVGLSVEGQSLISLRFMTSRVTLENDGISYQGAMQFRALLNAD